LRSLETMNRFYCDILSANGFDGSKLRMDAPTRATYVAVTEPLSKERVKAIQDAKTSGQLFFATGGQHLNSNEFFQARAMTEREAKTKELEAKKKALQAGLLLENTVMVLLQTKGNLVSQNASEFTVPEIKMLLKWKKVKPASARKVDLLAAYYNNPPPLPSQLWTPADEMELVSLKADTVGLIDTALGVATTQMARAVRQNLANLDPETRAELKLALEGDEDGVARGEL
jgi:hypothetical protein